MPIVDILTRVPLLFLSLASFIPQLHRLHALRDTSGISLIFVLLNLIVATEQLALGLHLIVVGEESSFDHDTPTVGDWLNVCQFIVVWLYHIIFMLACFDLPPRQTGQKTVIFIAHLAFLSISLVPVVFESAQQNNYGRSFLSAFWAQYHYLYISPVVTLLGVVALFCQARTTLSRTTPGTLSVIGLAAQAVVFALVGVTWIFRLTASFHFFEDLPPLRTFLMWYQIVGWAAVDNLIFAFVQAILFCIAWNRRGEENTVDETTPLLL